MAHRRTIKFVLLGVGASALGLTPSPARAFHGNLLTCTPTAGMSVKASISPGLTCTDTTNKIQVSASRKNGNQIDNCFANLAASWATWATVKIGSKIAPLDVARISKADVSLKATGFGSCNLSGDATSYTSAGSGKFTLYAADGVTKIKGGQGSFFGRVLGDLPTQSALTLGVVTKGFGAGAALQVQIAIDFAGPSLCGMTNCNALLLSCNTGAICPPDIFGGGQAPITTLDLITAASSNFRIDFPDNADCVGAGNPLRCCTGAGTGTCE